MRRRRQNRSTWFPIIPFFEGNIGRTDDKREFDILVDPGASNVLAIPLIPDNSANDEATDLQQGVTLQDFVSGQTCVIERIVGKIVWSIYQAPPGQGVDYTPSLAICCTAFAVLPVGAGGEPIPASDEYDPLRAQNSHLPYLWRRTWILANNLAVVQLESFQAPACNEFFASRDDGPHIDTKGVRRRIQRDERIFMIHSVLNADPSVGSGETVQGLSYVNADLRVLGRMTRAKNRSTFR